MSSSLTCWNCQAPLQEGFRFCPRCAAAATPPRQTETPRLKWREETTTTSEQSGQDTSSIRIGLLLFGPLLLLGGVLLIANARGLEPVLFGLGAIGGGIGLLIGAALIPSRTGPDQAPPSPGDVASRVVLGVTLGITSTLAVVGILIILAILAFISMVNSVCGSCGK